MRRVVADTPPWALALNGALIAVAFLIVNVDGKASMARFLVAILLAGVGAAVLADAAKSAQRRLRQ